MIIWRSREARVQCGQDGYALCSPACSVRIMCRRADSMPSASSPGIWARPGNSSTRNLPGILLICSAIVKVTSSDTAQKSAAFLVVANAT